MTEKVAFEYAASDLPGYVAPQVLEVTYLWFSGHQYSPFWNDDVGVGEGDNFTWNADFIICNQRSKLSVKIGGDECSGVVRFIEKYGFYEGGGVRNEYRVDPSILLAVLTGSRDDRLPSLLWQRYEQRRRDTLDELKELSKTKQELEKLDDSAEALLSLQVFMEQQQNKIEELKQETANTLALLHKYSF